MWATILNLVLGAFAKAIAEVFQGWQRDRALKDTGRAEATAEGERAARAIQQDVTNAISDQPAGRDDIAARADRGGL